jgi:hypothetical protein
VKTLQLQQVQQLVLPLVHVQADHDLVTIHSLLRRVHRGLAIIHLLLAVLDRVQREAYLVHRVQQVPGRVDQVVQAAIVPVALADRVPADQVVQAQIVPVALVGKVVQAEIVPVALVDRVQLVPVAVLLVPEHQVEHQVEHLAAGRAGVQIQPAAAATQQAHLENQVADLLRVASQSGPSVKSLTT